MRIGIVSDLHGRFPRQLHELLAGVDRILCAGDVEREAVLWELQTIAPVTAVRGNNDWAVPAPPSVTIQLGGARFFLVHRPQDVGVPAPDVDVVVHGHTHVPRDETVGRVRYLNPGSATYPRGGSDRSCITAQVEDGLLSRVEFLTIRE